MTWSGSSGAVKRLDGINSAHYFFSIFPLAKAFVLIANAWVKLGGFPLVNSFILYPTARINRLWDFSTAKPHPILQGVLDQRAVLKV